MKGCGVFCIVIAVLNLLVVIFAGAFAPSNKAIATTINGVFMFGVLGLFLISRANKKKKDQEKKDKWNNG